MKNRQNQAKPLTKSAIARAYGVDIRTFNKWLKPILRKVGKPNGRLFTPYQVKFILNALGVPPYPDKLK